jgi:uncharacterized protein YecE (DUF72 family)
MHTSGIAAREEHRQQAAGTGPLTRIGIGGWSYKPWRDNFYPEGLPQAQELTYASRHVTSIEINSTFYGLQKPAVFAKWRDATPDDFLFSVKAPRFATHRAVLAEASESIERFIDSGIAELGRKLGPVLWQFPPAKQFEHDDFAAFLALLPRTIHNLPLRHVLEVRHPSFMTQDYVDLARAHDFPTVFTDSIDYPSFADRTGEFIYARLMRSAPRLKSGYTARALDDWAERARDWNSGVEPDDLPYVESHKDPANLKDAEKAEVFIYFINGAKERAPAAAQALLERMRDDSPGAPPH